MQPRHKRGFLLSQITQIKRISQIGSRRGKDNTDFTDEIADERMKWISQIGIQELPLLVFSPTTMKEASMQFVRIDEKIFKMRMKNLSDLHL